MTIAFALIFLIAMAAVAAFAVFIARNVDHGEARFDSETGERLKQKKTAANRAAGSAVAAQRMRPSGEDNKRSDEA